MTGNAPANWYVQPDGSQRYWDGARWTDHIVPANSSGAAPATVEPSGVAAGESAAAIDDRAWWRKKRVIIPGAALIALFGISAVGAAVTGGSTPEDVVASASPPAPVETPSPSPEPLETLTMPDLVGMNLQEAQDSLQDLGSFLMDQEDASGAGRLQVIDANWRVCTQEPGAGETATVDVTVVLASVLDEEYCPGDEPAEPEVTDEPEEVDEPDEPKKAPAAEEPDESVSKANARRSAESYLAFSAFSRSGLIDQLKFEGYETSDAEYAADAVGADWNAQAKESASTYLNFTAFSRTGLIDQLKFEGFTTDQATFGVDAVKANWNEQAVKSAESYLAFTSFSRAGLIDQLIFEGFTRDQATHGANGVGL